MPNLLASTLWGGLYLFITFILCFGGVAGFRLLQRRRSSTGTFSEQKPAEKEETEEKKPREVYYLVEKRKKPKSDYSRPKKISFDD